MTSANTLPPALGEEIQKETFVEEIKEAVLSFISTDDLEDTSKKTKRRSLLRTSSCGKILFLDEDKTEYMALKPRDIERMGEPKKYLCLTYGPKDKPMFKVLDFTGEPSESLDDWEAFLRQMMGLEPNLRRRHTENIQTMNKPTKTGSKQRIHSAFQPSFPNFPESEEAKKDPKCIVMPDDVFGHVEPTAANGKASGSESPGSESLDSDLSSFCSLKSTCSNYQWPQKLDCLKDHLSRHQFKDYKEEIIVTGGVPGSVLHCGDSIEVRDAEGSTPMDARRLREYIRTKDMTDEQTIPLIVTRGVALTVRNEELELSISIKGPKKTWKPDVVDAVMSACNTDQTRLHIAEINGTQIPVGTRDDQVAQTLKGALQDSHEVHLHLIPKSLLTDEHDNEAHGDDEHDRAHVRPITVDDSRVSSTPQKEETDC